MPDAQRLERDQCTARVAGMTFGPAGHRRDAGHSNVTTYGSGARTVPAMGRGPRPRSRPRHEHAREHAALASPTRLRLLDILRRSPSGAHPDELADHLALHPSTVRGHLSLLVDAGFVEPAVEQRLEPGRPRVVFRPTTKELPHALGTLQHQALAKALSRYLRWSADPADAGAGAGRLWATDVMRQVPTPHGSDVEIIADVVETLAGAGFVTEADRDGRDVVLVHPSCPFVEVAEEHADVVCAVHLGLVEGVVEQTTGRWELAEFAVSIDERACVARLRRAA
jgi:predicted ArsR family transcriptional regulator